MSPEKKVGRGSRISARRVVYLKIPVRRAGKAARSFDGDYHAMGKWYRDLKTNYLAKLSGFFDVSADFFSVNRCTGKNTGCTMDELRLSCKR